MKLAFIFDTCFKKYKNKYFSVNLTQELWCERYLPLFDDIVVVGRYRELENDPSGKLIRSDSERVKFKCIKNKGGVKRIFSQKQESDFIIDAISDCDAVICRSWWGVKECKKLGKPYMIEVISCIRDALSNHSAIGRLCAIPAYILQKKAIKNAPYVLYVTKEFLQHRYPTNGESLGISDVVLESFDEDVLDRRMMKISTNQEKITIGTAAALNVKYKGQRFVIKALAELKKKGIDNIEYQLVGSGDSYKLKDLATKLGVEDQVKIIGSIPHENIFNWYDSIDIYVQPSLVEGLPRSVVEAMSRGLTCICTNRGGMPELVDKAFIYSVKGNIPKKLADKIVECMSQDTMRKAAKINFEKAKKYGKEASHSKRQAFLKKFADSVR